MSAPESVRAAKYRTVIARLCDRLVPNRRDQDAVDLTALAKHLGVVDLLYKASRIHGYTVWADRGPTLFLAMAKTEGRRRATLAHECAHLVLNPTLQPDARMDLDTRLRSRQFLGDDLDSFQAAATLLGLERLCDRIAFELLVPQARASQLRSLRTAEDVRNMASLLHVSLALVVNEANKAGVPISLLRLARAWDSSWIVVDTAGVPSRWEVGSYCDETTNSALNNTAVGPHPVNLELRRNGSEMVRAYSVLRHRTGAIAVRA